MIRSAAVVFDSNIYIYALNTGSVKHQEALGLVSLALNANLNVFITHQNLNETFSVITDRRRFQTPFASAGALVELKKLYENLPLASPSLTTIKHLVGLTLKYKVKDRRIFDAFLVATMLSNSINTLYTDNGGDFKKFKEIRLVNPFKNLVQT